MTDDPLDLWSASRATASGETFFLFHRWIEALDLAILAHRPDGEIVYLNSATAGLVGVRRRDILGHHLRVVFGDDWYDAHARQVASANPATSGFVGPLVVDSGHAQRHLEVVSTVNFDSEGGAAIVWLLMGDVTRLVIARDELAIANTRLSESNRDLEDFAFIASHDLQEPLRKIVAFGSRLRQRLDGDADDKTIDYLDRMESASTRMQTLIHDLLSLSRVTTQGQALVPVDLEVVVREVIQDLEIAIAESDATINCGVLPAIDGDAMQLRQLFQNLIGNALKFRAPDRSPEVWVEAVMIGGRWLLSVRDNGIGFGQEYAEKVFTMFQRLHGRSQYDGTGVGLAICRKIVERHGGTIRAQSEPGSGAVFLIDLPRSTGELANAA